jgi:hypothetical protein
VEGGNSYAISNVITMHVRGVGDVYFGVDTGKGIKTPHAAERVSTLEGMWMASKPEMNNNNPASGHLYT